MTVNKEDSTRTGILCSVCHKELKDDDELSENRVEKCGELQYIELMHESCSKNGR